MKRIFIPLILLILLVNGFFLAVFLYPVPSKFIDAGQSEGLKILDRHGDLIYQKLNPGTGRQSLISIDEVPEHLKNAFLAAEDKRFYDHSGVDLRAILRAIWQNVSEGETISGGSTITQQLVRNLVGIHEERTLKQKLKESIIAFKLSKRLSKNEVFELYLNNIYFGGLAYGVEAASQQYFSKSVSNLGLSESAFLAGLPQAPNRYYPFEHFEKAKKRQEIVLRSMKKEGMIEDDQYLVAMDDVIDLKGGSFSKRAPHFVDFLLSQSPSGLNDVLRTTLDLGMQERVDDLIASDLTFLSHFNIENAAVVILDNLTGGILTMVGSADYENEAIDGQVNVATSLRQPGSSIKPLVYALAFENGWSPSTVIVDEPVRYDTEEGLPYSPKNYDLQYHGKVTAGQALAQSLNIPAVKTLDYVGLEAFLRFSEVIGISTFDMPARHYGLSLALGSGEVKLLELANAYRVLANGGQYSKYLYIEPDSAISHSAISTKSAEQVGAILSNNDLRLPAFGEENPLKFSFPVAAKTGTTRDFRDNWTLGYTDDYTVGVWVGNSSGERMQGVSGISGAGPIFYKIMNLLHEETGTYLTIKEDLNLEISSPPSSDFIEKDSFRITNPFANDVFAFDINRPAEFQKIRLAATEPAKWYVDNQFVGEGREVLWPIEKGTLIISAKNGLGDERSVTVTIH